jgi:hypothetical protein
MHKIESGHPKDHTQSGDVAVSDMPWRGVERAEEGED